MSDTNKVTVESYNTHAEAYVNGTPSETTATVKGWLDRTFANVAKTARVLEIGAATGRDARYVSSLGYKVECSDAALAFVSMLQESGFSAHILNVVTDPIAGQYDCIFANAVVLHFTKEEMREVTEKIYHSLDAGGIFAFTLIEREADDVWYRGKMNAPRYFTYWTRKDVEGLLKNAGFHSLELRAAQVDDASWLQVIAKK